MNFLISALAWVKANKTFLLIIVGFAIVSLQQCGSNRDLRKQLEVANHNIKAINDTLRVTKDKDGKDEANKLALLTDKLSNLEKLNADLASEVKSIKGKVGTIIKGDVVVVHDTIPLIVKSEFIDSTVRTDFNFSKTYSPGNFRSLTGYTKYDLRSAKGVGELTSDSLGIRFTTGIKNLDKGTPEIFLKSDYPGFSVTQLDGAVLDPKLFKKTKVRLLTTGLNIGWTPVTYDAGTKKLDFNLKRFGATAGVNINILKLLRK